MKVEQIAQMVIAGVVVALIMEWLRTRPAIVAPGGGASVSTSAVWFNPVSGEYEPL